MKLVTLNTHSLLEENYLQKRADFASAMAKEMPDIIALQEVSQTAGEEALSPSAPEGYFPVAKDILLRRDNHAYHTAKLLAEMGTFYHWTWLPVKLGYGRYDEGLALLSRSPIIEAKSLPVSRCRDYRNWKTRKILGIRTADYPREWFFSVHYGWWRDQEEPFVWQWEQTVSHMSQADCDGVWLMGDFNNPAHIRGEGYDLITGDGWQDSYLLAQTKDDGITVEGLIDGWREQGLTAQEASFQMRIDQIWCDRQRHVLRSRVLFNRRNYPIVSDHYGVMIETAEKASHERSPQYP